MSYELQKLTKTYYQRIENFLKISIFTSVKPRIQLIPSDKNFVEEEPTTFSCHILGSPIEAEVIWIIRGKISCFQKEINNSFYFPEVCSSAYWFYHLEKSDSHFSFHLEFHRSLIFRIFLSFSLFYRNITVSLQIQRHVSTPSYQVTIPAKWRYQISWLQDKRVSFL